MGLKFVFIPVILVFVSCAGIQNTKRGDICLDFSMPYANTFLIVLENEEKRINTGFWGLGIGLDYYHSDKQFLNFVTSGAIDFFLPIPAAIEPANHKDGDEDVLLGSINFSLSNNHRVGIFTMGYGLSYAINLQNYSLYSGTPDDLQTTYITKYHGAFGLVFPISILYKNFIGGRVVYKPTFFRPNLTNKFAYEHLISIEFVYKLRIYKAK
jgi:hypothetical protein